MDKFKKYYVADAEHQCCFGYAVKFKHNETDNDDAAQRICECPDEDTAKMICDALNRED